MLSIDGKLDVLYEACIAPLLEVMHGKEVAYSACVRACDAELCAKWISTRER